MREIGLLSLGLLIGAVGTAIAVRHYEVKVTTKNCNGYTKIGYGKGVTNCGDTIRIREFNELYKEYEKHNQ